MWKRLLGVVLLLPTMAQTCELDALGIISPDANVDPASVVPDNPLWRASGRYRSFDGTGNHETHFRLGAVNTTLIRRTGVGYGDGVSRMGESGLPSAREISNAVCADSQPGPNVLGASDFLWQWGQFVDHDADESSDRDAGSSLSRGCVDVVAGGEQLRHEIALPIRASEVIAVDLEHLCARNRGRGSFRRT